MGTRIFRIKERTGSGFLEQKSDETRNFRETGTGQDREVNIYSVFSQNVKTVRLYHELTT